jgi:hypothetical protein
MIRFSQCLALLIIWHAAFLISSHAQTATIIPANEEFLQVGGGPSVQADTMRKPTLADYLLNLYEFFSHHTNA